MASQKYHGKLTAVYWRETGGSFVDISGASRQFSVPQQANEIDVSTRDDKNEDATQYLADTPGRTASLQGLDTTPQASRVWEDIDIGDTGTLLWYPLGNSGTGRPYRYADGVVLEASYESPYDGPATWSMNWRLNTAVTKGTS